MRRRSRSSELGESYELRRRAVPRCRGGPKVTWLADVVIVALRSFTAVKLV